MKIQDILPMDRSKLTVEMIKGFLDNPEKANLILDAVSRYDGTEYAI